MASWSRRRKRRSEPAGPHPQAAFSPQPTHSLARGPVQAPVWPSPQVSMFLVHTRQLLFLGTMVVGSRGASTWSHILCWDYLTLWLAEKRPLS